jgi:hypothetical protein
VNGKRKAVAKTSLRPLAVALAAALLIGLDTFDAIGAATLSHDALRRADRPRPSRYAAPRERARPDIVLRTVTNCDDDGPGSLRDTIATSLAGSIVDLTHLDCSVITLTSGAIAVSQSVDLVGPLHDRLAIEGNGRDRVFVQSGAGNYLGIKHLALLNGTTDGDGGCIDAEGRVSLGDVAIELCTAGGSGGAVAALGDVFAIDSRFIGNIANGAAPAGGGAISAPSVIVSRSTLAANHALSGNGGAILTSAMHPPGYYRQILQSTLYYNRASVGGAVFVTRNSFYGFEIMQSTISGNSADRIGAVASEADLSVYASTIADNADDAGVSGGIYLSGAGRGSLFSSILSGNTAAGAPLDLDDAGGALYGEHDLIGATPLALPYMSIGGDPLLAPLADNGGPTWTRALMPGSPAIHAGSYNFVGLDQRGYGYSRRVGNAFDIGAYTVQSTGVVRVVENCNADGDGSFRSAVESAISGDTVDLRSLDCGTIALEGDGLNFLGVDNLTVLGPGRDRLTIEGSGTAGLLYGGFDGTLSISGVTLTRGNGLNGGCVSSYSTVRLDDVTISGCTATYLGGGGVLAARIVVARSTISGNRAASPSRRSDGGGLYAMRELEMHETTVSDNVAAGAYGYSLGGGIVVAQPTRVLIDRSTISNNVAGDADAGITGYAGGIGLRGVGGYTIKDLVITNSTISGNGAASAVGGVSSESTIRIANSTIAFNTAAGTGDYGDLGVGINLVFRDYTDGFLDIDSAIVANNVAGGVAEDLSGNRGTLFGAHDLVMTSLLALPDDTLRDDPMLIALADKGGPTRTHALASASPAIDAGSNPEDFATDQRGNGFPRTLGGATDIGAFESDGGGDGIFMSGFDTT